MKDELFAWLRARARAEQWNANWDLPNWQMHRGSHLGAQPENTLAALVEAQTLGAPMCEFDVQLTRDQKAVLFHDATLERMTGKPGLMRNTFYGEFGADFTPSTLHDVLTHPKVPRQLNIELKTEQIWNEPLERRVAAVIRETQTQERILFSSFNPFSLWKIAQLLPEVPRALLVARDLKHELLRQMALLPFLRVHALHFEDQMIENAETVQLWRQRGFKVAVWTVNEAAAIEKFWDWGVDSVITDLRAPERKKA